MYIIITVQLDDSKQKGSKRGQRNKKLEAVKNEKEKQNLTRKKTG
jgi:hypothetical protein